MKNLKIFRIIGILITLSLLLMVLPVTPVFAVHSITLSPTSGNIGDTVTVYGSFDDSMSARFIRFYFSSNNLAPSAVISSASTYEYIAGYDNPVDPDTLADNVTVTFYVPAIMNDGSIAQNVTSGTYYVYAAFLSATDSLIVAKATFTVSAPIIDISPTSGPAGTTSVQVLGSNFPASTALVFKFDTTIIQPTIGHTATTSTGVFLSYITIPSTATAGSHTITASAGTSTASATFTVTASPEINLIPATGSAGTSVTITGQNFPVSTALSFKFDTATITISSGDVATSSGGAFTSTITIPSTATAGAHTITATVGTSTASATFTVTGVSATLNALSPTSGPPGTGITISGTSFAASTALVFQFGTSTVTPTSGSTQTGSDGSFSSVIAVPSGTAAGTYTITVTAGTTSDTATFTVTAGSTTTPTPTTTLPLSIDQEDGDYVGGTISIGGSGFLPNTTVSVTIDGTEITEKDTDVNGFVVISFKVPSIQHGEHTVIATDGTNIASANFTIESTSPQVPQPLSPAMGEAIESPASFDWEDVTDVSSPVTYRLQIATSDTFAPETILLDLTGITTSAYTLKEAEQLKLSNEVTYYWREKAVDAAFNESIWTGAGEFTMIKPFEFIGWPLYLTISLGGLILFLLGLWVGRRTAFYY